MMNREKIKLTIKFTAFVLVTFFCVGTVNEWLKPKYYYTETWPTTNTYKDFYKLEKNSVDVLFFGSSHTVSTLNPQVIYDHYGITSYNLGCEQQSLVITYYWLREALKYQSPKVVILDTYMLHKYIDGYVYNNMNCDEGSVRKPMDSMRISPLKWEASKVIERIDPTQSGLSFMLLNIRYHTRWTALGENDFTENGMIDHGGIKGFSALGGSNPDLTYTPFKAAEAKSATAEEMVETSRIYLDKVVELCKEKEIQLVLVNIPCAETVGKYKVTKEYADSKGLPYYDFNEETLYYEIGYNASENLLSHPNYLGAAKVSNYLGNLLVTEYGILPKDDPSYDISRELYEHRIENIKLTSTTDIYEYLDLLNNDKYSVFVFGPIAYSSFINDEIMNRLTTLGFTTDLRGIPDGTHYCAIKDASSITEKLTDEDFNFSGSIREGLTTYSYTINTTNMLQRYKTYNMTINGVQCGNQKLGLDIVVYDNELKTIIDKINFNTTVEGHTASRY